MTRPRLLDLFCGQGGAASGYAAAGFDVLGVDVVDQPRYPFPFVREDAMRVLDHLARHWAGKPVAKTLGYEFAAIHASPPCQDHSATKVLRQSHGTGWMLAAARERLAVLGIPWVVENVEGAPLARQADLFGAEGLELCGCMFPELRGLLYENRIFEASFGIPQPPHSLHRWPLTKMGRPPKPGECMQVTGHFSDTAEARRRMNSPWMTREGLAQAIPPAYSRFIGEQLMAHLQATGKAA
jgi:DNA (cytosine-5)-methyltransferase 1